jgi:hypothetical protein
MASPAPVAAPPSDHLLPAISLMLSQEESEDGSDEEEDDVHDGKGPARLQHRARLGGVDAKPAALVVGAEDAQVDVDVAGGEVGAIGVGDAAKLVDTGDQGADKGKIDQADKGSGAAGGGHPKERGDGPYAGENRDDEKYEDEAGGQLALVIVAFDEPGLELMVSDSVLLSGL